MWCRVLMTYLVVCPMCLVAEDEAAVDEEPVDEVAAWTAARLAEMKEYELLTDRDGKAVTPKLIEQPLLNWSNPLRSTTRGALFLWATEGEPQFVCCTFPDTDRIVHEVQSLSDGPITWSHPDRGRWQFDPPADFEQIPDAPVPAASRPLRLIQMRRLAARFSAQVTHPELTSVRRLPQPAYRYPEEASTDGAIFAFVQGTDPECLLVFKSTEQAWSARIVRMTSVGLIVRRDDQLLREFEPSWEVPDRSYKNFYIQGE